MAIDDVMSDYETSVASTGFLSIQPASGDEWMVTHFMTPSPSTTWELESHTADDVTNIGSYGGVSGGSQEMGRDLGVRRGSWFITNSEYVRIQNSTGATNSPGFSAIKTKE